MFNAYRMGSHIVYICCVEFQTFRLKDSPKLSILTNVFSEIVYEPINVGLSAKIENLKNFNTRHVFVLKDRSIIN